MKNNPLNIVSVDDTPPREQKLSLRAYAQAKFDRLWLQNRSQFNPLRNCIETERLERSLALVDSLLDLKDKSAVDLGCGAGVFSCRLRDKGAIVTAVDVSANALKAFEEAENLKNITLHRDYVPKTLLEDSSFDVVVALDLIAFLDPKEYRLFFAELTRLVKPKGCVLCSTPIDIHSDNALQRFASLAATELHFEKWVFSHHALSIRIKDFFLAPSRFVRAFKDKAYREEALSKRYSLNHFWFRVNSTVVLFPLWYLLQYIVHPIIHFLDNSKGLMRQLEKLSRLLLSNQGISHAIFLATPKPFVAPAEDALLPIERKHKKQLWE